MQELELVPEENLAVIKVKAHRTAAAKKQLETTASRPLGRAGTAEARATLQITYLNELADKWAKKGASLSGPPAHRVRAAKAKAADCKSILEFVAHFRVELKGLKTTTWEPEKGGKGARRALREARLQRVQRLQERRQEGGRQHSFETIGNMSVCRKCNRRAFTAKGRQKLELQACDPAAHRLNQRARDKARRQAQVQGVEQEEEALDAIAPVGPQGHRLAHVGPLSFCLRCACYSVRVG